MRNAATLLLCCADGRPAWERWFHNHDDGDIYDQTLRPSDVRSQTREPKQDNEKKTKNNCFEELNFSVTSDLR